MVLKPALEGHERNREDWLALTKARILKQLLLFSTERFPKAQFLLMQNSQTNSPSPCSDVIAIDLEADTENTRTDVGESSPEFFSDGSLVILFRQCYELNFNPQTQTQNPFFHFLLSLLSSILLFLFSHHHHTYHVYHTHSGRNYMFFLVTYE